MTRLFHGLVTRPSLSAFLACALVAVALTWPLPAQLNSAFLGPVSGDLGVYVWNLWIFSHEAIDHARLPFSTDHVFAYTSGADFALHNYTPVAGLLAMPLLPAFGLVAAFNVILLLALATSGWAVFVLARRVGLSPCFAWIAGALFMATPVMTARSTAHVSLVAVAAVPLFLVALLDILDRPRRRTAVVIGAAVAIATYCDAYFGIYCVVAGGVVLAARLLRVTRPATPPSSARIGRCLNALVVVALAAAAVGRFSGREAIDIGPLHVALGHAHNPLLIAMVLALVALWMRYQPRVAVREDRPDVSRLAGLGALAVTTTVVLLSPMVAGVVARSLNGRLPDTPIYWRSSPRGVDLLAYIIPNPAHPWIGQLTGSWFMPPVADAFPEFVAAFPLAAWTILALAWNARVLPGVWVAFSALFMALSLGPFINVGGVNSEIIGPWALLRYVPVIGMARSPSRFAIIAAIGLSLLTAFALQHLWHDARRRGLVAVLLLLLGFEALPVARPLYSPEVPEVYRLVAAADDEQGALLDLPTGMRDGASSVGDFRASSQYFQATHRHRIVGGYLSRVSEWRKRESTRAPVLRALFALSEPQGTITPALREAARDARDRFLARTCVRHVVIDRRRASPDLQRFAVEILNLEPVYDDRERELWRPVNPPACDTPQSRPRRWRWRGGLQRGPMPASDVLPPRRRPSLRQDH